VSGWTADDEFRHASSLVIVDGSLHAQQEIYVRDDKHNVYQQQQGRSTYISDAQMANLSDMYKNISPLHVIHVKLTETLRAVERQVSLTKSNDGLNVAILQVSRKGSLLQKARAKELSQHLFVKMNAPHGSQSRIKIIIPIPLYMKPTHLAILVV
jgi:hypothetical protein